MIIITSNTITSSITEDVWSLPSVYLLREQSNLVDAISSMSTAGRQRAARNFLEGLSTDELRYIAGYLGTRVIDPDLPPPCKNRNQIALSIERYEGSKKGPEPKKVGSDTRCNGSRATHRMMVLLEYLSACSMDAPAALAARAGCA